MNRTTFLVDGFNLYHSICDATAQLPGAHLKWLDVRTLCASFLHVVGNNAQLEAIYYFSALARHRQAADPDVLRRHQCLLDCLDGTGVHVELGRFKAKLVHCPACRAMTTRHGEKETDVAIAVRLVELFFTDACDTAVLVTGDTDLAPAIRTVRRCFPTKAVVCAFPYARKNKELATLAGKAFNITAQNYARYQLPNPYVHPSGRHIQRPASW